MFQRWVLSYTGFITSDIDMLYKHRVHIIMYLIFDKSSQCNIVQEPFPTSFDECFHHHAISEYSSCERLKLLYICWSNYRLQVSSNCIKIITIDSLFQGRVRLIKITSKIITHYSICVFSIHGDRQLHQNFEDHRTKSRKYGTFCYTAYF